MKNIPIIIFTLFIASSCYEEEAYDILSIEPDEVITKIESEKDTLLANGTSRTTIKVHLPIDADNAKSTVTAITSNGVFTENNTTTLTKEAILQIVNDSIKSRYAEFILKSPSSVGNAKIKFKVASIEMEYLIIFEKNYLEAIKITPSSLVISASSSSEDSNRNEIEVITTILSGTGTPSTGQTVNLFAKDTLYNDVGTFRIYNNMSNAEGISSFRYSLLPDSTYIGKINLIAVAQSKIGTASDTISIYSKK